MFFSLATPQGSLEVVEKMRRLQRKSELVDDQAGATVKETNLAEMLVEAEPRRGGQVVGEGFATARVAKARVQQDIDASLKTWSRDRSGG